VIHEKEMIMEITALADISKNSEITFVYAPDNPSKFPLWFE
jgi:hypothetical protein